MPTFAIKAEYSKPTFGENFSGHDSANFIDRQPTAADDGDHHGTAFELDPVTMDDAEVALLDQVFAKINRQSVRRVGDSWVGLRISMLPSDGRV